MKQMNTRSMVEGALLAAITIIISLFSLYVPVLGVFASLVWPVPIVILGIRHGTKTSILATVVAGIVVAMLEGPMQAFTVILGFGLIGIMMGWAIRKEYPPFRVLTLGGLASLLSKAILILISIYIMGLNPLTEELSAMRESLSLMQNMYKGMGVSPDTVKSIVGNFEKVLDLMALALPGILILASLLDAFLNYQVTRAILSRLGQKIQGFTPFWLWNFPTYTVFIFLLGVLLTMLETYWPVGVLRSLGLNLQIVFYFVFMIQGFSLIAFYMGKFNIAKLLRVFVVLLIFFNPFISQIVIWAGMFDILFNFRHI